MSYQDCIYGGYKTLSILYGMMPQDSSIATHSLVKSYAHASITAVNDVSFSVNTGEIFGFLGPNGAGKSTTIMILTTLLKPTSGKAFICGIDVAKNPQKVRYNIGYVQQESTADEYLTGRENLLLHARLNHIPKAMINDRIDQALDLIELKDRQDEPVITYSGGMRKRLDIAGGLLHMPKVLFLDEPTVGLDIQTRRKIWGYIKKIHDEYNMTIFLTTHYMEEADQLCDRIGIIDYGKIQVIDTPENLKNAMGNEVVSIILSGDWEELIAQLKKTGLLTSHMRKDSHITLFTSDGPKIIPEIFQISAKHDIRIDSITLTRPTLDDVFISYTGRKIRDDDVPFNRQREHAKMMRLRS